MNLKNFEEGRGRSDLHPAATTQDAVWSKDWQRRGKGTCAKTTSKHPRPGRQGGGAERRDAREVEKIRMDDCLEERMGQWRGLKMTPSSNLRHTNAH